jgi:hypothetical protein
MGGDKNKTDKGCNNPDDKTRVTAIGLARKDI